MTLKKVSIIIPFYGQTEQELAVPLGSINNQIGVDFSQIDVHLVNDGGAPLDISQFDIFAHLDLHYHELPDNGGPGLARQYGIDHSESTYLMFIDSDDELSEASALFNFFEAIKKTGDHQMIWGRFVEVAAFPNLTYNLHDRDSAFLFAKWFNRDFIKQLNLRFRPELRLFEDVYFVQAATSLATDILQIPSISYVWRWRKNSLIRGNGRSAEKRADIACLKARLQLEFLYKSKPSEIKKFMADAITSTYMFYKKFSPVADEAAFEAEFRKMIDEFSFAYEGYTAALQMSVSQAAAGPYYQGINPDELKDFLEKFSKK